MLKTIATAVFAAALSCSTAFAQNAPAPKFIIDKESVPKSLTIHSVNDQANAEQCAPPRKLVITSDCVTIKNAAGNEGKRCKLGCK